MLTGNTLAFILGQYAPSGCHTD